MGWNQGREGFMGGCWADGVMSISSSLYLPSVLEELEKKLATLV